DYATVNGSAIAGPDYVSRSGTLSYPAGTTAASFTVPIVGDRTEESTESFSVSLSNATGATIAAQSATITVLDNDNAPVASTPSSFSIGDITVSEGNAGSGASAALTVRLTPASASAASVRFATSDNSARAGDDYLANTGILNFAAGATEQRITIQIVGDASAEPTEDFLVALSSPTGADIDDGAARVTISDDDSAAPAPVYGLSARPSNTSCLAPARTTSAGATSVVDAFPSLADLGGPMKLVQPEGDSTFWYVPTRGGKIERFENRADATAKAVYLELPVTAAGEGGLLSIAFHPDWPARKELFASYTIDSGGFKSRLSRLVITNDASLPASYSEQVLLTVDQPADNHNGGDLAFGPDGYLYYGLGDGGGQFDPDNLSQDTTRLLGSILRLDVVDVPYPSPGYRIPADNPFAGNANCGAAANSRDCPEIYAWGFRNPWRMSFDGSTLWAADVGQNRIEEINQVRRGGNYGWSCREGTDTGFNTAGCPADLIDPVYEYRHSDGNGGSVTGGFVYRNADVPSLNGRYLFGDFLSGKIWKLEGSPGSYSAEQVGSLANVSTFGRGNDGRVYALSIINGDVFGFSSSGGVTQDNVPELLSQTGCVDAGNPQLAADGLLPYSVAAPFWSDAADKERWMALPNGSTIDVDSEADWHFPRGSVLMKHFRRDGRLLETRLMMRHPDGDWAGYSYEWNSAQTEANRVRTGRTLSVGATPWRIPSESECLICHTSAAGFALGPETAQLNSDHRYSSTGVTNNQLEVFNHIGMFSVDVAEPVSVNPRLADPYAVGSGSLEARARAYLHTNCAQCHQPGGGTGSTMDLRHAMPLRDTGTCDVAPQSGNLGISGARIIDPGSATTSVLLARMDTRGTDAMPPLGSNRVDDEGVALLRSWINTLPASCD
ncbi:MAG: PQQ-dependent sugar dehydrogenase, partial [Pseudomonadota bacterium]